MRLKNLDLIVTMLIAAINVGWALLPDRSPIVGIIFVLPLVFVLPGYTLTEVLFKRSPAASDPLIRKPRLRIERPFNASDRLILSLGLSLGIDILSGFVLDMLPIGLQALSWAVFLGLLTTVFSLIAAFRRRGMRINAHKGRVTSPWFRITIYECILFGLAIIVATLSVWYSTNNAKQQQYPDFTQFWMLPSKQANDSCAVLIGVHSYESTSVTYRIVVTISGAQVATWSPVVLAPQEEWEQPVSVKPEAAAMYVEAKLYRADKPGIVYREVHMTLNSSGGSTDRKVQCLN